MNVHFMNYGETACGIDPFTAGELRSTPHPIAVTCPDCKASQAMLTAVQRLPVVPPRPTYQPIQKVR
jgi:hypothetical protein